MSYSPIAIPANSQSVMHGILTALPLDMFRTKQSSEFPGAIAFRIEYIARNGVGGTWSAQGTYAYCVARRDRSDADCRAVTRVVPVYGPANEGV